LFVADPRGVAVGVMAGLGAEGFFSLDGRGTEEVTTVGAALAGAGGSALDPTALDARGGGASDAADDEGEGFETSVAPRVPITIATTVAATKAGSPTTSAQKPTPRARGIEARSSADKDSSAPPPSEGCDAAIATSVEGTLRGIATRRGRGSVVPKGLPEIDGIAHRRGATPRRARRARGRARA
jgi:hypothetical protein